MAKGLYRKLNEHVGRHAFLYWIFALIIGLIFGLILSLFWTKIFGVRVGNVVLRGAVI
ncbi:MAG: hypothetical protein ABH849_01875 [Nanoarchaeota archaeon]